MPTLTQTNSFRNSGSIEILSRSNCFVLFCFCLLIFLFTIFSRRGNCFEARLLISLTRRKRMKNTRNQGVSLVFVFTPIKLILSPSSPGFLSTRRLKRKENETKRKKKKREAREREGGERKMKLNNLLQQQKQPFQPSNSLFNA